MGKLSLKYFANPYVVKTPSSVFFSLPPTPVGSEYYRLANENTAVIPLVESAEGVRNFAEIVHTPDISAVFLGPVDLSVSMGLCGDLDAPEVKDALLSMIRLANAAGVPVGALGLDPVFVKKLFREGLDFLAYGIDTILIYRMCRDIVQSVLPES